MMHFNFSNKPQHKTISEWNTKKDEKGYAKGNNLYNRSIHHYYHHNNNNSYSLGSRSCNIDVVRIVK